MEKADAIRVMKKANDMKGALIGLGLALRIGQKYDSEELSTMEELMEIKPGTLGEISKIICDSFKLPMF
jgi:hypothetical protein